MGPPTSHPKQDVLWLFIALASAGFEPGTLGSSGKHFNHHTTEATLQKLNHYQRR
jgi:hypothetical protein